MNLKEVIMLVFKVSLFLTVFGFGLRATKDDVLYLFHRPGLLVRSLLAMFVIMPMAAVELVHLFDAPRTVEIVLVALAISPIPPMLPKKVHRAGSTTAYGLGLLTTISLLSIVLLPLSTYLLGLYFNRPFAMPASAIAGVIIKAVVLPIIAGMAVKRFLPDIADRIDKPIGIIAGVLLTGATLVLVGGNLPALWRLVGGGTLFMMGVFILIGLAVGHVLGGPGIEHRGVLALASASRHPAIALSLANANYPGEHFGGTVLLYLVVNTIICIPYIQWRKSKAPVTA